MSSEWQPIETFKPEQRGMSHVIVWNGIQVTVAWFSSMSENWQETIGASEYGDNALDQQPTHWMPFPDPPSEGA